MSNDSVDKLFHTVTLEGPDGAGHWDWRCLNRDCDAEATGYEPDEVVDAASEHGPLAANAPIPALSADAEDAEFLERRGGAW